MLPFFKKKKKTGAENSIDAADLLGGTNELDENHEEIDTDLSFHPDWNVPEEEKYVYAFHNTELSPLKPNQLSLSGINMEVKGERYIFTAFIRQTLSKNIQLKETPILLLGPNQEKLARKVFDLSKVGTIPSKTSRPWFFIFEPKDFYSKTEIPREDWSLAFELKPSNRKHQLDLAQTWKESLADETIEHLENIVSNATPLKPGEVNFMGISIKQHDNQDLAVTLLIRNGSEKNINLEQIPLKVEDASGDVIAQGNFKLNQFEVKANTSKPWTFIFPKSMVTKETLDLSKWKAYPVQ
ncbi:accessory Sec system S-layer assembly protein [Aquibacillus sediminis]|uniref:accessory Sec system S-layer assembly protein n=1 Tax=Aquibacillus sediminis TaxID=2574734 RepID=UPI0011094C7D|nr:accessory Sec system S-layer assembly protein [Aquibacillus sediminis]